MLRLVGVLFIPPLALLQCLDQRIEPVVARGRGYGAQLASDLAPHPAYQAVGSVPFSLKLVQSGLPVDQAGAAPFDHRTESSSAPRSGFADDFGQLRFGGVLLALPVVSCR